MQAAGNMDDWTVLFKALDYFKVLRLFLTIPDYSLLRSVAYGAFIRAFIRVFVHAFIRAFVHSWLMLPADGR
jgi:hypothetical protein